ncbi:MAG: hypothetical protein AAGC57_03605 [Pseudomonadota bacterium]
MAAKLPNAAMSADYADHYACQLQNGGHRHYIKNSRPSLATVGHAERGLDSVGLAPFVDLHRQALTLGASVKAAKEAGGTTDTVLAELSTLDQRFLAADSGQQLRGAIVDWSTARREKRILPYDGYAEALAARTRPTPPRRDRARDRRVGRLLAGSEDRLAVAVQPMGQMAFGNRVRDLDIVAGVAVPGVGADAMVWRVDTDHRDLMLLDMPSEDRLALHACSELGKAWDGQLTDQAFQAHQDRIAVLVRRPTNMDRPGDQLASLSAADLDQALQNPRADAIAMGAQLASEQAQFGDLVELCVLGKAPDGLVSCHVRYAHQDCPRLVVCAAEEWLGLINASDRVALLSAKARPDQAAAADRAQLERLRNLPLPPCFQREEP